jgi:membrane protease YdiL (CAAX protease family)
VTSAAAPEEDAGTGGESAPPTPSRGVLATLLAYLIVVTAAEVLVAFGHSYEGLFIHIVLVFSFLLHASALSNRDPLLSRLLLALILVPLVRILSLSIPFWPFSTLQWLALISVPLNVAALAMIVTLRLNWRDAGLRLSRRGSVRWELLIIALGPPMGVLEFFILRPESWLASYVVWGVIFAVVAIFVSTGLAEELIFRGVLLHCARGPLGSRTGLLYVTLVFASLHIGFLSPLDLAFAFTVGLIFGIVVLRTGSIAGVVISHTLVNVTLYLVAPLYL